MFPESVPLTPIRFQHCEFFRHMFLLATLPQGLERQALEHLPLMHVFQVHSSHRYGKKDARLHLAWSFQSCDSLIHRPSASSVRREQRFMHTKSCLALQGVHARSFLPWSSTNIMCFVINDMDGSGAKPATILYLHDISNLEVLNHYQKGTSEKFGSCSRRNYMSMHVVRRSAIALRHLFHMQGLQRRCFALSWTSPNG